MGLLATLISLLIISVIPGEIIRFDTQNLGFVLSDILAGIVFVYILFKLIRNKKLSSSKLFVPGLLFIASLSLSLIFSPLNLTKDQFIISSLYLIRWIFYFSIYLSFVYLKKDFLNGFFSKILLIAISFFLFLGYFQVLFYPDLRNLLYAGWDEHLYRFFGTFLDPNFAGAFLVLIFIYALHLILSQKSKSKTLKLILVSTFIAIFLTFSRSSYLMLVAGVSVLLFLETKRENIIKFLIICGLAFFIVLNNRFFGEGTKLFRTASIAAREASAKEAIDIFKKNPITGVGFNSYKFALQKYNFYKNNSVKSRSSFGTDDSFLFILATSGLIGFSAFLYFCFAVIKFTISQNKYSRNLLLSTFVAILIGSFLNNLLFYPFIMIWYWIILGSTENT